MNYQLIFAFFWTTFSLLIITCSALIYGINGIKIFFVSFRFLPLFPCRSRVMLPLLQGAAGVTGAKSSESMGVGQGTPWTSRRLIAGPMVIQNNTRVVLHMPLAHSKYFSDKLLVRSSCCVLFLCSGLMALTRVFLSPVIYINVLSC